MLNVFADRNIPYVADYIPEQVRLTLFNPDDGFPEDVAQADALLVRTVSAVNRDTLSQAVQARRLSFVGTASAGYDHVDITFLRENNIVFASAEGCNAAAVAEYVATGLLHLLHSDGISVPGLTVGVVGCGNAGSATANLLEMLGFGVKRYDPPRQHRDRTFTSATVDDILACDIITFHVPLQYPGQVDDAHVTHHWMDAEKLNSSRARILINASRGGVVDEKALIQAYSTGSIQHLITDVWENEPNFDPQLVRMSSISTPHIAGYSEQAKRNATRIVLEHLCAHFALEIRSDLTKSEQSVKSLHTPNAISDKNKSFPDIANSLEMRWLQSETWESLSFSTVLEHLHPMFRLSDALKSAGNPQMDRSAAFRRLRTSGTLRQEYTSLAFPERLLQRFPELEVLSRKNRTLG